MKHKSNKLFTIDSIRYYICIDILNHLELDVQAVIQHAGTGLVCEQLGVNTYGFKHLCGLSD